MKSNHSFTANRRALIASAMAVLLGAATAVAQSGSAGSTSSATTGTTGSDTSRRTQSNASPTPGGTYDSRSTTGSSTTDRSTDSTGRSAAPGGNYGAGSTSTTTSDAVTGRSTASSDKLSWGDRRFVNKAADAGQAEVQMAQLAAERATNTEVRNFAQKLIDHHTKVNSELKSLASKRNLSLDTDDDKDRAYKRLNKKSGAEFDEEFVEHMIDEHEKDIKMFEKAASDAKDPELRSFASKHVGALRNHLQAAQNLRQSVMPTGRTDDRSGRSTPGTGSGYGTSSSGSSTDSTRTQRDSSSTSTSPSTTTGPSGTSSSSSDTSTTTRPDRSR